MRGRKFEFFLPRDFPHLFRLLLWVHWRTLLARRRGIRRESPLLPAVLGAFVLCYLAVGYWLFHSGLNYLLHFPLVGSLLAQRDIYRWKFLEALVGSSWALVFLSAPLMLAFGRVHEVPANFYAQVAAAYLPFVVLPALAPFGLRKVLPYLPGPRLAFFAAASALMSATLSGLAVGRGALFPNFKEDNPSRIVSGFGGTLCLVVSFASIASFVALTAVPDIRRVAPSSITLSAGTFLFLAVLLFPLLTALRRVKTLEI
ncbi:MAG: hypothetical protein DVB27_09910 [Verrucomicrobia bacterium]|nr:MAG: hypothetical protein DVB27_09910 [Verrucomicrobiota bacterium]